MREPRAWRRHRQFRREARKGERRDGAEGGGKRLVLETEV